MAPMDPKQTTSSSSSGGGFFASIASTFSNFGTSASKSVNEYVSYHSIISNLFNLSVFVFLQFLFLWVALKSSVSPFARSWK